MTAMANFEYLHTWILYDDNEDSEDEESLESQLNRLGQQGWELVNMTPHWEWTYDPITQIHEYQAVSEFGPDAMPTKYTVEAPYSFPDYIRGWYCTFKRSL
ncbi:MAG: DUF4177 domain-containing protein [Chloroflexi bacterium]|nr:DUF4177 domain-containing protein [Chloroflexota bacterium]